MITALRDPLGNETNIDYDAYAALPLRVVDPLGLVTTATIDSRILEVDSLSDENANRTLAAYTLPSIDFELGGVLVTMNDVEVYTTSITDQESNDLHCNIGRTAMADFEGYAINFRSMSLTGVPPTR